MAAGACSAGGVGLGAAALPLGRRFQLCSRVDPTQGNRRIFGDLFAFVRAGGRLDSSGFEKESAEIRSNKKGGPVWSAFLRAIMRK